MIGLAILYFISRHIAGLEVGRNMFYEDLPIDMETGAMNRYGIYAITESAPMSQNSDNHNYINIMVAIGEGAVDINGQPVAEKYETDRLMQEIQALISNALSPEYASELCRLDIPNTSMYYRDIRILPSSSKLRGTTLTNGAIVKSLTAEVYYKNGEN
jgi:hypothetical protein